jgi:hypothetical protein
LILYRCPLAIGSTIGHHICVDHHINAVRIIQTDGLILKFGYFIFNFKNVLLNRQGRVHELIVVFRYHESSDPRARRIELGRLSSYAPSAPF